MNRRFALATGFLMLVFAGCKGKSDEGSASSGAAQEKGGTVSLNGAGATFPYPLYSKWMSDYNRQNPNIRINYQSIGSGGGIRQIMAGTVDFGATDAPMTEDEAKKAPAPLAHIPATIGAVAVAYNLPGGPPELKLTGEALVDIYLGNVKTWNDPKIAESNPGATLPATNISVIYRTDGSGTTAVFTEYLAAVNSVWKDKVGVGKSVKWPVGLGAKGNEGVTGQVKTTPGSLGYIELAYALQNKLPVAAIKNKAGQFVKPELAAISAAAEGVELGKDLTASLVNAEGAGAYPIASYSYILVYENSKEPRNASELAKFLWWAVHDGQASAEALHYAKLPPKTVAKIEERLKSLRAGDKPLL